MTAAVVREEHVEQTARVDLSPSVRVLARKAFDGWSAYAFHGDACFATVRGHADEHEAIAAVLVAATRMADDVREAIDAWRAQAAVTP